MLSKNNRKYQQQRQAQRVPHYGLRKLSVGVASVLLSTTLYMGVTAHADTVAEANPQPTTDQPASAESDTSTGGATANTHVLQPTADQPASAAANNFTSENDANTSKQPVNTVDTQSTSGNSGMTSENAINSAVDAKADSNMPAQPLTGMSAASDNKQADTMKVNTASPVRPKLRLAVSQPVTENPDTSDVNVDLTNYWKQPADMTKATSAGGHTDWLDNGPNYVDAKVTDFKATMYEDNATLSTKDWYRIGYQISFDTDTANLQPSKILHLFRLTETSDTGYLPMISPDNTDVSVQWNGKNLGIIHSSFHNIKTHEGSNDLTDYIDINLEITAKMDGVGNQHVTLSVPWNNILNYYRPYSWRGAPETNKVTLVVTNNDFKYTKESTWKLGQTEYSPMTSKDNWSNNSYLPMDVSAGLATSGASNIWFNTRALAYVDATTARDFYKSGAKMPLAISDDARIRSGYRIYTNNGNKLVLEGKVGDATRIYPGRVTYPIVLPDGTVTSRGQDYDNYVSYPMPGADLGLAEIANQNLTLAELKALNKTGLVVSAQDDGSINAYLNLPVAGMRQHDTPVNRQWMYNEIVKHSVGVNYSKYAANPTELKQLLKNTVDYYFNGPTKGLPLSFGVNAPKLVYHLANMTEPTKVIAASIADHSLAEGAVAETRATTYTPNLAKVSGQSAVRFHYVSGFNGVEIQTGDIAVGKPDSPVNLPTFPTLKGYNRQAINTAGAAIKLGNGSTLNLPAGSQVLVDGSALNFGDENTWHDYYVVYDPVFVSKSYRFIDDINSKPVGSDTSVKGYYNQTIKTGLVVPTGYKLAANQILPTQVTLDVDDTAMTLIHLIHQAVAVTPDHPQANGTKLPENPTQSFHGVEASDLNKTATRTIKVTTPDGQTKTVTQNVKLTRTATVDEVTGEVTYGDWSTGQWDAYKVSTVAGYTATQTAVAAVSVNKLTTDQTVDVSYTANTQTTTVKYVDDKGDVVHTTTVDGVTNQTVKVPSEVPAGWKITKGQVPSELTFGTDGHEPIEVTVAHQRVTVDSDHPQTNGTKLPDNPAKTFTGVEANDLNKTATRTIKVTQPNGTTTNKVQTAKLTRSADVDEVTGEVAYGDWTTGEWAAYDTPSIAGYKPSQTKIDKETVTAALKDTTVEITYTPNQHQISVEYIDDDGHGKVVKTDQVPGKTDQTITVTPSAPANYDLVDSSNRIYTVTSSDGQTVQIHVKHHKVTTSEDKTVTRTINVHTPHDGVKTVKQTAELNRDVTTNQVTGDKTYGDWTTGQWKAYTPEAIPGYTRSANEVPAANVDGSTTDQTVDVTYTANTQHVDIVYVDDAKGGSVVKTDQVVGKTDETVKVTPDVPASYQVVSEIPGDYTMTADGHQTLTVHLAHQTKTDSESKAVTRTINVNTPHDGTTVFKQTVDLNRDVTTDQVTGDKTYGDWSTTEWTHYDVPAVAGYTPSMKQVAQQVVNGATTDQTVDVTYTANDQTTHVNYVDGDGNTVHATTITGKTDQTVKVPNETPAGWKVVGESVPTEITFGPDGHADVAITVDHKHVTVTPDQPKTPNDKLPNNPGKTYPDGVGRNDLNRTVTRTIKVTTPDGQTKTVTQKVQLTRTADIDEVTGKVTYGKWTTGEWTAVEISAINGYTPSTTIPAQTVDYDTKDKTVSVTYTPNHQQRLVQYVDDAGHVIHTTTLTGVTDQTVAVPNEVPTNWKLVNPSSLPNKVELSASGNQPIVVTIKHQVLTVQPDQAKTPADHLPDGSSYQSGVDKDSLNKTVTRTIKVTAPDHTVNTVTQTAQLHRKATIDLVTKTVTYGDWSTDQWNQYKAPPIAGYTTTPTVITAQQVTKDTENQTVTVNYQAQAQSITVKYQEPNGQVAKTEKLTGYTDQPLTITPDVPNGYELVPGQKLTYTPNSTKDQSVVIKLQHKLATTQETQPVTRTIKITQPNGQQQTIKQTVTLHRTVTVDQVTHEKTYGDWSTAQWDAYQVPVIAGYAPNQNTVAAATVTSPNQSTTVDVDYQANDHTTTIKYVDSTGKVVHTTTVHGHTDQTVKVPNETPAGWQVVNDSLPNELHFGANGHVDVTVTVQHRTVTVQADQPVPNEMPLPNNPTQHYHGVEEKDLNKTITRTIKITSPQDQTTTTTQQVLLHRSATIDEVTGEVTYGDWSTGQWTSFVPPVVEGYTPSLPEIANQAVTAENKDQTIAITYAANPQTAKIQYKDKAGTILHEQIVHGKTGETVKVPNEVPAGWRIVNGQNVPANITFGTKSTEPVTVTVEHATVTVQPNQPKTPADSLPDDPTKNYPSGVGVNDLNQNLTRTITIKAPGQAPQTITQPAHLMRSATVDEVTGEVTYSDWSTDKWPAVKVPSVPGYTPNVATISAQTVTDETKPTTITVNYAPNEHTTQLQYVDDKGDVIKTVPLNGVTGETVSVPQSLPAGWALTPTTKVPATITMTANGHPKVVATVQHGKVTVTADKPKTTADSLPDNPNSHYPTGVGENDLNQTLTRTINLTVQEQKARTITQTVTVHRSATVDEVTGKVTYSDWSTAEWPEVNVPNVPGYTPSTKTIPAKTVTNKIKNTTVTVNYTVDEHTTQLQYVDEKGAVIKTVPLHGVTGETVYVPKNLPAGWVLTPTTKVPTTITMTTNGHPTVIITVQHGKVTVIPDKPKTTADPLPDNPYNHYPTGVGENDLNQTLTRTINLTVPGQKTRTITQNVTVHRSATVDEVTGEVTYNDWSTAKWSKVTVPNVLGYTPSTDTIPAQTVTDKIKNTTVTVNYTADEHTTQLQYVDEQGNMVETLTLQGRTGETVSVPTSLPAGWVLTSTTKVPATITMTANGHPKVVATVKHSKVTVIPDKPKTTADTLPDNPNSHYPTGVGENDLNKTLTRTINLTVPGQKARTITQTVTVHRSATVDEVTGEVTYDTWSTAEWPEVNVPSVQGYTPNQKKVPAEVSQADHGDQTVTIAYHKDSIPNKTEKQTSTVKTKTVEPTKPMPTTETTAEKHQSETKSMPTKTTNTASTTLPQTGDAKNAATWLGVINMLFTGLVGWWTKKKHKPQA